MEDSLNGFTLFKQQVKNIANYCNTGNFTQQFISIAFEIDQSKKFT